MDLDPSYELIRRSIPPFAALRAFEAFARLGGVRKAAAALEIDHSAVSRHIKNLQDWIGVALISRDEHGNHLTPSGKAYYRQIAGAFRELSEATRSIQAEDQAHLSICCAPGFAVKWLVQRIHKFQELMPNTQIDVRPTDQPVDFTRQTFSGEIRYHSDAGPALERGLRSVTFSRPPVFPIASLAYLDEHGPIESLDQLKSANLLHEEGADEWTRWFAKLDHPCDQKLAGTRLWHAHLTIEAAVHGKGIALANDLLVRDDLACGRLVKVPVGTTACVPEAQLGGYVFIASEAKWRTPTIQIFRRWLTDEIAQYQKSM